MQRYLHLTLASLMALALAGCNRIESSKPDDRLDLEKVAIDGSSFLLSLDVKERLNLQSTMLVDRGLPAFRRVDNRLELVDGCYHPANLEFHSFTTQEMTVVGNSLSELELNAIRGIVAGGLKKQSELRAHVSVVGKMHDANLQPNVYSLTGDCNTATHVAEDVYLGAFETLQVSAMRAGAGVAFNGAGIGAKHQQVGVVVDKSGSIADCKQPYSNTPPRNCDAPVLVKLRELAPPNQLEFYFDTHAVSGAQSQDVAFSSATLVEIAAALDHELARQGQPRNLQTKALSTPGKTSAACRIFAATVPGLFGLECKRNGQVLVQEISERDAIASLIPIVARQLLDSMNPTAYAPKPRVAKRIVILLDISASMLVHDSATFITSDIRNSSRYQLIAGLMNGLLELGAGVELSLVTFAGTSCASPRLIDDKPVWPLDDNTRDRALDKLATILANAPTCGGPETDIADPLLSATQLLARADLEGNAVILLTDGFHTASDAKASPKQAARELIQKTGTRLTVVRLQHNDLSPLRKLLNGPHGPAILSRWTQWANGESWDWRDFLSFHAANNDAGKTLFFEDLAGVEVGKVVLGAHDALANPLQMVYDQILPELGAPEPVDSSECTNIRTLEALDGSAGAQMLCESMIARGRPVRLTIKKPLCMESVSSAFVQIADWPVTELQPIHDDGTAVTFEQTTFGKPSEGGNLVSNAKITVNGRLAKEIKKCARDF